MATSTARRSRPWTLAAGVLLAVTTMACGPAPTPVSAPLPVAAIAVVEPVTEPVDPRDAALIERYWTARQRAWDGGVDRGVAFLVDRLHPELPYTEAQCTEAWFGPSPPAGFLEQSLYEPDSLARDDDWTMRTGPLQGMELDGDVYTMAVTVDYLGAPEYWGGRRAENHLEVIDGQVRNFLRCDVPQITFAVAETVQATPTLKPRLDPTVAPTMAPTTPAPTYPGTPLYPSYPSYPSNPQPSPTTRPAPTPTPTPPPSPTPAPTPTPTPTPTEDGGSRDPGSGLDFCAEDGLPSGDYRICPDDDPDAG